MKEYEYAPSLIEKYLYYPREFVKVISENEDQEFIIHNLYEGSTVEGRLGYSLYDGGVIIIPENLINYIDYKAIGRDLDIILVVSLLKMSTILIFYN